MSKSDFWENALLLLLLQNANVANVGDATGLRGSTTAGSLFVSLHTADPGETGTQAANEISYTGYARVAVARSASGFTVSGNAAQFASNVDFGTCTAGSGTATHWSLGLASTGATSVLYKSALSPTIAVSAGVTPRINAGVNLITED